MDIITSKFTMNRLMYALKFLLFFEDFSYIINL